MSIVTLPNPSADKIKSVIDVGKRFALDTSAAESLLSLVNRRAELSKELQAAITVCILPCLCFELIMHSRRKRIAYRQRLLPLKETVGFYDLVSVSHEIFRS